MKFKFIILFTFLIKQHFSQGNLAVIYYDQAVNYFNHKDYKAADSLFTLSNNWEPHKDTYFSRANCRLRMGDKEGYCMDLSSATRMGDKEANKLFWKDCGKTDTVFLNDKSSVCERNEYSFKVINYKSLYSKIDMVIKYDTKGTIISFKDNLASIDSISNIVEETAGFPGGIEALSDFIQQNLKYPSSAREQGISGKCYARFVINEDGGIGNIQILKGVPGCIDCDNEVVRVITIMPFWKPAKMKGKPVKCYFNMPFSFNVR